MVFVGLRLINWIDGAKPERLFNPVAWLVYLLKVLFTLIALALLTLGVEFAGQAFNQQLKEYCLSKEVETSNDRIVAETKEPYTIIRYRFNVKTNYERFFIVEYHTRERLIRQGIKPDILTKVGQKVTVLYSREHPTFF